MKLSPIGKYLVDDVPSSLAACWLTKLKFGVDVRSVGEKLKFGERDFCAGSQIQLHVTKISKTLD